MYEACHTVLLWKSTLQFKMKKTGNLLADGLWLAKGKKRLITKQELKQFNNEYGLSFVFQFIILLLLWNFVKDKAK